MFTAAAAQSPSSSTPCLYKRVSLAEPTDWEELSKEPSSLVLGLQAHPWLFICDLGIKLQSPCLQGKPLLTQLAASSHISKCLEERLAFHDLDNTRKDLSLHLC